MSETALLPRPLYATFTRRFRALVLDLAVITAAVVALVLFAMATESVPGSGRIVVGLLFALLLYEPLMVWRYGATLGHRWANLHVVASSGGRPNLGQAFLRHWIKSLVGLPSFVTMLFTRRHQALHDVLTRTTVQVREPVFARPWDYYAVRGDGDEAHTATRGSEQDGIDILR